MAIFSGAYSAGCRHDFFLRVFQTRVMLLSNLSELRERQYDLRRGHDTPYSRSRSHVVERGVRTTSHV